MVIAHGVQVRIYWIEMKHISTGANVCSTTKPTLWHGVLARVDVFLTRTALLIIGSITEKSILKDMPTPVQTDYMAYPQTYRQTDVVTATNNVDHVAAEASIDTIMPLGSKPLATDQQQ